MEINIGNIILDEELEINEINLDTIKELPILENLNVIPNFENQEFVHNGYYGYDKVFVNKIESQDLDIMPSKKNQEYNGIFKNVKVKGDENLVSSNIRNDIELFGIKGTCGAELIEKDINFYDYDGTLLYSYTLKEFDELKELPPLPEQPSLICQCWNWNLDDIKTEKKPTDVGAIYITDDGKTKIYLKVEYPFEASFGFCQSKSKGVLIDFGDGSEPQRYNGYARNTNNVKHYYEVGEYVLTFTPDDDCNFGFIKQTAFSNKTRNAFRKIHIGKNLGYIYSSDYKYFMDFQYCYFLEEVIIPNIYFEISSQSCIYDYRLKNIILPPQTISDSGSYIAFRGLKRVNKIILNNNFSTILKSTFLESNLKRLTIPNCVTAFDGSVLSDMLIDEVYLSSNLTTLGSQCFLKTKGLKRVELPNGILELSTVVFNTATDLVSIVLPDELESVPNYIFRECSSLTEIKF